MDGFTVEFVCTHVETVYANMYRNGKKKYGESLRKYARELGVNLNQPAHKLFDGLYNKPDFPRRPELMEALLFAFEREMINKYLKNHYAQYGGTAALERMRSKHPDRRHEP